MGDFNVEEWLSKENWKFVELEPEMALPDVLMMVQNNERSFLLKSHCKSCYYLICYDSGGVLLKYQNDITYRITTLERYQRRYGFKFYTL